MANIIEFPSDPVAPNNEKPSSASQTTTPATHPALASHAITWKGTASLAPVRDTAIPPEKEQAPAGAFAVINDAPSSGPAKKGRRPNRLPPRKPVGKKKRRGGLSKGGQSVRRGNGFAQGETENLLELLQEHLPLAKDDWEKVARLHEVRYPQQRRNADSIRKKFSALCRTALPTGDHIISSEVLTAKEIRKSMTELADIGEGDESGDEYTEELHEDTATVGSTVSIVKDTLEGDNTILPQAVSSAGHPANPSPRLLIRKRPAKALDDDESIVGANKASMLQEQMGRDADYRQRIIDREEEKERREEERRLREKERLDERERRAEERNRSEQMTQMMMVALPGPRAKGLFNHSGP